MVEHDICIPTATQSASIKEKIKASMWDLEVLSLPPARFYCHDCEYHADPREFEIRPHRTQ